MGLKDLFSKKNKAKDTATEAPAQNAGQSDEFVAFLSGKLIPIEDVPDDMFASKMLGDGVAIEPTDNTVVSPVDGVITLVMDDSLHACGIKIGEDMELLIHIGVDTVAMNGDGFSSYVKAGDTVKAGDKLLGFDSEKIKAAGFIDTTMLVIVENGTGKDVKFLSNIDVKAGETKISE